ncbi:MAG: hypothetical protein ABI175_10615, partial [Polyangiales bacterium]
MPITRDPERLGEVAGQLGAAIRSEGRVRLPMVQPSDAAGLVMVMHGELDDAIEDRGREATAAGHYVACSAGCSSCCVAPVLVTEGEAVTVAEWLKLPANAEIRAQFVAAYPAWKRGLGATIATMHAARSDEQLRSAAIEMKTKNVMCAFNREGLCTIYAARPARCRKAHALETNANCGVEGTGQVRYYEHERTEATFDE